MQLGMELKGGLVVDDHTYMRSAMRAALTELGIDPVHEASSLADGRELVADVAPVIAVMDLNLDDGTSYGLISGLKERGTRVMALTSADDAYTVRAAHAAGAMGYLLKSAPHETVMAGLREVLAGRPYADPTIARMVPGAVESPPEQAELSLREISLLQHVAEGLTHTEIAERIGSNPLTVKSNLAAVARKLGATDRETMLAAARRLDLLL